MTWVTHWLPEIGFVIRGHVGEQNALYAEVEAYEFSNVEAYDAVLDEDIHERRMPRKNAVNGWDQTSKFEDAERYVRGSVKWDGCSDLSFDDNNCALHFCSREDLGKVGRLLEALYDLAAEVIPHADANAYPIHQKNPYEHE